MVEKPFVRFSLANFATSFVIIVIGRCDSADCVNVCGFGRRIENFFFGGRNGDEINLRYVGLW